MGMNACSEVTLVAETFQLLTDASKREPRRGP